MRYSNPRKYAEFNDWPSANYRVRCTFAVERGSKGERVRRVTDKPNCPGVECAPKLTTFAYKVILVDGEDERIYIMNYSHCGMISVISSDMKHSVETFHCGNEQFNECLKLFRSFENYNIEQDREWNRLIELAADAQTTEHNDSGDQDTIHEQAIAAINACEIYAKERGHAIQWPGLYPLVKKV